MIPFDYPPVPRARRHGPRGYVDYERFRQWLRDEFEFRCVYCLLRERWVVREGGFAIEHFLPVSRWPQSAAEYDNLLYACTACNLAKAAQLVPDPSQALVEPAVRVPEDGRLEVRTPEAREIAGALGLNDERYVRFRKRWLRTIQLAQTHDPRLVRDLLSYPDDLPDLSRRRPPGGNSRPEGIEQSHFARREQGELAEVYWRRNTLVRLAGGERTSRDICFASIVAGRSTPARRKSVEGSALQIVNQHQHKEWRAQRTLRAACCPLAERADHRDKSGSHLPVVEGRGAAGVDGPSFSFGFPAIPMTPKAARGPAFPAG